MWNSHYLCEKYDSVDSVERVRWYCLDKCRAATDKKLQTLPNWIEIKALLNPLALKQKKTISKIKKVKIKNKPSNTYPVVCTFCASSDI